MENSKKIAKKLKILKKIPLWLHFKLLGWKSPRTSENKNYRSVTFSSYPMHDGKFQKKSEKIKNFKKIPLLLHFNPKYVGKC